MEIKRRKLIHNDTYRHILSLSTVHSCYKTVQNQSVQCSHDGFHFWVIGYEKVAWTLRV
ncbi:Uncharacterised protein [Segatella copri]|nr:Uncharacterised protein [Segatella copri]